MASSTNRDLPSRFSDESATVLGSAAVLLLVAFAVLLANLHVF